MLSSDRLKLRKITVEDAPSLFTLMNDKDWILNIGDRGLKTIVDAENYIEEKFHKAYESSEIIFYALTLKSTQEFIGIAGLIDRDSLDNIDIGYGLLPEFRGHGYAFEATKVVYDHGLINLQLEKIIGIVNPDNEASISILKKLGLNFEKMIQLPDENEKIMLFS